MKGVAELVSERAHLVVARLKVHHDARLVRARRLAKGAIAFAGARSYVDPAMFECPTGEVSQSPGERIELGCHKGFRVFIGPCLAGIGERSEKIVKGQFRL